MTPAAWSPIPDGVMDLSLFKKLLLRFCGHSFEDTREQTLVAGLGRRMAALGMNSHVSYHDLLVRDRSELHRLMELLMVNETYFFREAEYLNLVVDRLLPEVMTRTTAPLKILSVGCSTGEEPYSLAIMLQERFGAESERLFSITGVDIDAAAIVGARQGTYGRGSFRSMDPTIRERYFSPGGQGRFQLHDSIRNRVEFDLVNLLQRSYPRSMHAPVLILYRNVSIYFPRQVQAEIFGRLAQLLPEGGYLVVGVSETLHHDTGILTLVNQDELFFFRKKFAPFSPPGRPHYGMLQEGPGVPRQLSSGIRSTDRVETRQDPARIVGDSAVRGQGRGLPSDIPTCLERALDLARDRKPAEALLILEGIMEHDDSFAKACTLKARILINESQWDEAAALCRTVLQRDPLCLEACLLVGMVARHTGDDVEAFRRFREALYLDPHCWIAHFHTAEMLYGQRELKRARKSYEHSLRALEQGGGEGATLDFSPLSFNREQFMVVCRHKLSLLKDMG